MSAPYASKEAALHAFWTSFGIAARNELSVPDDAMTLFGGHYITYNAPIASLGETVPIYGNLYYKDTSWEAITAKRKEIEAAIGRDGVRIPFVGGILWIVKGVPFSEPRQDVDDTVRSIYINLTAEYVSAN